MSYDALQGNPEKQGAYNKPTSIRMNEINFFWAGLYFRVMSMWEIST